VRSRPLVLALAAAIAAVLLLTPAAAGAVAGGGGQGGGDDGRGADTTDVTPVPSQHIIPRPDSGRAPTDAGDRGGGLQILVFVALVAGVGTIAALALRDMRRSRARAGTAAGAGPHASGP
jgi:hypothetical protein